MSGMFPNTVDGAVAANLTVGATAPSITPVSGGANFFDDACGNRLRPEVLNAIISELAQVVDIHGKVAYDPTVHTNLADAITTAANSSGFQYYVSATTPTATSVPVGGVAGTIRRGALWLNIADGIHYRYEDDGVGALSWNAPTEASETLAGVIEIATTAEIEAATSSTLAMTPANFAAIDPNSAMANALRQISNRGGGAVYSLGAAPANTFGADGETAVVHDAATGTYEVLYKNGGTWGPAKQSSVEVAIPYAATITPDMADGSSFTATMTGDMTVNLPANPVVGDEFVMQFIQDATGGRALSFAAWAIWDEDGLPAFSTAASTRTVITGKWVSSTEAVLQLFGTGYTA